MADEYQKKYRIPSLTTDALVLRKHKNDEFHDILLVTRGNYPEEGKLAFPGGFVEYGEEPEFGCIRELKEETDLDGKDIELLTVRGNPKRDPRRHVVSIFYLVNVHPESEPKGGDDARDAKFYDLKDIIENRKDQIAFDHYGVIEELVQKKFKDLYNFKGKCRLKSLPNNIFILDKLIKIHLEKIKNLKVNEIIEINTLINKKNELDNMQKELEKLYEEKINKIKDTINEMINEKWQVFDEKVKKIREIKLLKEGLDKNIDEMKKKLESSKKLKEQNNNNNSTKKWINNGQNNFTYSRKALDSNNEIKLKSDKVLKEYEAKKNITISTEAEDNYNNSYLIMEAKNILDNTINSVKEIAKENIKKKPNEMNKIEQIEKIKKITNEAVDEINRLTKYIVEQSNYLVEKLKENEQIKINNKIIHKEILKEEEFKCEKCNKKVKYPIIDKINSQNNIIHKGIRCNGCGSFIWVTN